MGDKSNIEWTDATWNFLYGCEEVSPGCTFCYAKTLSARFANEDGVFKGVAETKNGKAYWTKKINIAEERLTIPQKWQRPRMIFVNSMSDTFHEDVPLDILERAFAIMGSCPQHVFQVLTKRASCLSGVAHQLTWHPNIWMGVTVENKKALSRIPHLLETDAKIKFLSIEPLLEDLGTIPDLDKIDWVIVGGESGKTPRKMDGYWVREIREQCKANNVKFFFKQWGGINKKSAGRILDGRTHDEMPARLVKYEKDKDAFTVLPGQQLMWENHAGIKKGEKVYWVYER